MLFAKIFWGSNVSLDIEKQLIRDYNQKQNDKITWNPSHSSRSRIIYIFFQTWNKKWIIRQEMNNIKTCSWISGIQASKCKTNYLIERNPPFFRKNF